MVIAIIAILAAILLPALRSAKLRATEIYCLGNQKQLGLCWLVYAQDNKDALVGNNWQDEQHWLTAPSGENWISGWVGADGTGGNGTTGGVGGPDNTNTTLLVNPLYAALGDCTRNPSIFLCPSSVVQCPVTSGGGKTFQLCRSVSMNCWMGWRCLPPGPSQTTAPAPIDYSSTPYMAFMKLTDIRTGLNPSDAFVFIEERAESIDDGSFEVVMGNTTVANWPTDYHNGACTLAFADGHAEPHRWQTSSSSVPGWSFLAPQQAIVPTKWGSATVSLSQAQDLAWLQLHATRLK